MKKLVFMAIYGIFFDSLLLLWKKPKLFLPKMGIAFLYGLGMVLTAQLAMSVLPELSQGVISKPFETIFFSFGLLVFLFLVDVLDIFTNAMYPAMVKDFFETKKILFAKAARAIKPTFWKIFLTIVFINIVISVPISIAFAYLLLAQNFLLMIILLTLVLAAYLVIAAVFYFVYPLLVIKSVFFFDNFSESIALSRKKFSKILVVSLVPFFISLATFALAFFVQRPELLLVFLLLRFLIAILQTCHFVLNPSIFLRYHEL